MEATQICRRAKTYQWHFDMAASLFNIKVTLVSADTTFKEEAAGLEVHLHLNLQLAKDLGGSQWLAYD